MQVEECTFTGAVWASERHDDRPPIKLGENTHLTE
jgi:hypothetical protein